MSLTVWLGFLLAAILIAVSPGPGAVISISTGMRHGYWAALTAILGLQTALVMQLLVVALGMGALLATSALAFVVLKLAGAAYLVWLGVQKWRSPVMALDRDAPQLESGGLYLQGILVNLTNPKAIVFIAALVPQFVDPTRELLPQYVAIGLTLCLTDTLVMSGYALAGARLGRWFHDPAMLRRQNHFFGMLYCAAGVLLAGTSRSA